MKLYPVIALSAIVLVLGACGGDDDMASTTEASGGSGAASTAAPTTEGAAGPGAAGDAAALPQGTFERVVGRDEAVAAGFDAALVDEILGADGTTTFTFKMEGDRWVQFQTDGAEVMPGDGGNQHIDDDGHLVQVSDGANSLGATFVLDWSIDGDTLTMTCLSGCTRSEDEGANLVVEGTWQATS
jgi:hypothetical protein